MGNGGGRTEGRGSEKVHGEISISARVSSNFSQLLAGVGTLATDGTLGPKTVVVSFGVPQISIIKHYMLYQEHSIAD